MATFSDGYNGSNSNEAFDSASAISNGSGPGNLRVQLQALLDDKERQLKLAGTLGQRVLAQQVELEERISQLNDLEAVKTNASDEEAVEFEIREKLRELRDTMNGWETENQDIFDVLGNKANDIPPSPPPTLQTFGADDAVNPSLTSGPSAAQSSRRAKNAAHQFAFEIGSSLLTEVRRLQSLIAERDKAIQDLNEENQDLRQALEDLKSGLESQKSIAEKYKEENWNLEVSQQELRTQFQSVQKELEISELERKRTARELLRAKDSIDQHKTEAERLTTSLTEFKAKHETDIAQMRKQAAGLQRDKSDLQSALEALKSDMAKKDRSIKRFGSPLTPNGLSPYTPVPGGDGEEEEDVFGTTGGASNRRKFDNSIILADSLASDLIDSSPDPSPSRPHLAPNHPNNEIEVLRQSLAHAQRQVNMLRGSVQREKELRMDYRRKLADAEGKMIMEEADIVEEEEEENVDPKRPRPPRPQRGRGRGRGIAHRFKGGLGQRAPSTPNIIEMVSDEEEDAMAWETPEAIPIPEQAYPTEDIENNEDVNVIFSGHGRPVSTDGLDPAFANVLRPAPPSPTPTHASSPIRQIVPRGGRRTRGGISRNAEHRPPSLVEPVGALAAELGIDDGTLNPELLLSHHVDTSEMACQTDPEAAPEPVGALAAELGIVAETLNPELLLSHHVDTSEMACQTYPEVAPEPVTITVAPPVVEKSETGIQAEVVIQTAEANTQTAEVVTQTAEVALQAAPNFTDSGTSPVIPLTVEMEVQAVIKPMKTEINIQTDEPVSEDVVNFSSPAPVLNPTLGITRRGTIIGTPSLRAIETEDEEPETDMGTETEGEYTDAPEYPVTGSISDFYSARTGPHSTVDTGSIRPQESLTEFYSVPESDADDSDQESIKASTLSRPRTSSRITPSSIGHGYSGYDARTPKASLAPPPPKVFSEESIQVDAPVPRVEERSIQTEEWLPTPPPPPPPIAPLPSTAPSISPSPSFTLLRVGSHTHQFQYIAPPSISPPASPNSSSLANTSRDSSTTIVVAPRRTSSLVSRENDRRPSIEAALANDEASRTRTQSTQSLLPSTLLPPPDKTRPPTMMLPPPPRLPPPSDKKISTGSSNRDMPPPRDLPPPRPTSPPPPELIQRATTPTFGNQGLLVPSRGVVTRQHGSSLPPHAALGHRPSISSFRSAINAASSAGASAHTGASAIDTTKKQQSTTSLISSHHSSLSRRSSASSDRHEVHVPGISGIQGLPKPNNHPPPNRPSQQNDGGSTDPAIIHAITQTMIGEFLYKYTRKVVGKGHGQTRHKRFFWVHPYTKTLYWSSADPGSSNVSESSAKSAYIDSVRSVLDPNPLPPGLYQYSVVVSTPQREMKITAPTKERHDIWFNALNYLLSRPGTGLGSPSPNRAIHTRVAPGPTPMYGSMRLPRDEQVRKDVMASPRSARSFGSAVSGDSWNVTPRAQRSQSRLSGSGSVGKRSDTPAAEYLRLTGPEGVGSPSKSEYEYIPGRANDEELDFEIHASGNNVGFEGLENVRACCDGRHDLGTLSRKAHHHHHHHHHHPHPHQHHQGQHVEGEEPASRPVSPAWSFRSHAGSTASRGADVSSIWSRFGTKRSKAAPPVPISP